MSNWKKKVRATRWTEQGVGVHLPKFTAVTVQDASGGSRWAESPSCDKYPARKKQRYHCSECHATVMRGGEVCPFKHLVRLAVNFTFRLKVQLCADSFQPMAVSQTPPSQQTKVESLSCVETVFSGDAEHLWLTGCCRCKSVKIWWVFAENSDVYGWQRWKLFIFRDGR